MQDDFIGLNPLLAKLAPSPTIRPVPLDWDLRHSPHRAARVAGQVVSAHQLTQLATTPHVWQTLYVVSDLLTKDWVVRAHNPTGVTIDDVLTAIYKSLHVPLMQYEWECMSPMQCHHIEKAFYARCEASRDFEHTRRRGVRRMDCLLHTTVFAGLSSLTFRKNRWEVVLTLSRNLSTRTQSCAEAQCAVSPPIAPPPS